MNDKTAMQKQIESVPELMGLMKSSLEEEIADLRNICDIGRFQRIILTGCGDSYCAALAAKYVFLKYTDCQIEAVPVIELSRNYPLNNLSDPGCMVIFISNSGMVTRMIETCRRIKTAGAYTIAITGNTSSGLYQSADAAIRLQIPKFEYAPGIRSYCGCLYALYELAFAVGISQKPELQGRIIEVREELTRLINEADRFMPDWSHAAKYYAKQYQNAASFELIGSGWDYAAAVFGSAKSLETTGKPSAAVNTEDWFHMNFFLRDVYHTATILFTNRNNGSRSRELELLSTAEKMGRPIVCITDDEQLACQEKILTPATQYGELNPLVQYLPLSMLFSELCIALQEVYFRDGKDNWSACVDCATLIQSEEIILP